MKPVFSHLAVPVDGSTASQRGIAFALELARGGGRVSFCSVVDPSLVYVPSGYGAATDLGSVLDALDAAAAVFCRQAEVGAARQGIASDARVLHGPRVDEIDAFAARSGSDAIVIGTRRRGGLVHGVLGSVALGVLRHASVPVVTVHEDDAPRGGPLAVALDASPAAGAALDLALRIAAERSLPLLLVHVCGPWTVSGPLERAKERARVMGVRAEFAFEEGAPAEGVLRALDARACRMLVMGTHGRSPLARMVLGSVAAAAVERAHIPVITVRRAG